MGVVRNVNEMLGQIHPRPQIYQPFLQQPENSVTVLVRLRTEPRSFASSLRRIVSKLDPDQPVTNVRTMEHVIEDSSQGTNLMAGLMSAFAAVALAMAAFGIYGLLAYIVAARTQELGVRIAMGASRGDVLSLVLRRSMAFTLAGVGIGLACAFPIPKLLTAVFGTVAEHSWLIIGATSVVLSLTAILASYLPARRACRVDPMIALRTD